MVLEQERDRFVSENGLSREEGCDCSPWGDAGQGDMITRANLFLFQGQKGDPGLSPGQAHDGAKVGSGAPALHPTQEPSCKRPRRHDVLTSGSGLV